MDLAPLFGTFLPVRRLWVYAIGWTILGWSAHTAQLAKRLDNNNPRQSCILHKLTEASTEEDEEQKPLSMVLERVLDDNRLKGKCWLAEMGKVELWENERQGTSSSFFRTSNPLMHFTLDAGLAASCLACPSTITITPQHLQRNTGKVE